MTKSAKEGESNDNGIGTGTGTTKTNATIAPSTFKYNFSYSTPFPPSLSLCLSLIFCSTFISSTSLRLRSSTVSPALRYYYFVAVRTSTKDDNKEWVISISLRRWCVLDKRCPTFRVTKPLAASYSLLFDFFFASHSYTRTRTQRVRKPAWHAYIVRMKMNNAVQLFCALNSLCYRIPSLEFLNI